MGFWQDIFYYSKGLTPKTRMIVTNVLKKTQTFNHLKLTKVCLLLWHNAAGCFMWDIVGVIVCMNLLFSFFLQRMLTWLFCESDFLP